MCLEWMNISQIISKRGSIADSIPISVLRICKCDWYIWFEHMLNFMEEAKHALLTFCFRKEEAGGKIIKLETVLRNYVLYWVIITFVRGDVVEIHTLAWCGGKKISSNAERYGGKHAVYWIVITEKSSDVRSIAVMRVSLAEGWWMLDISEQRNLHTAMGDVLLPSINILFYDCVVYSIDASSRSFASLSLPLSSLTVPLSFGFVY